MRSIDLSGIHVKHVFQNSFASIVVLLLVCACASEPPKTVPLEQRLAKQGYSMGQQVKRITDYRINGWSSLDRFNIIFNVGAAKNYLITVRIPCDGLLTAEHVAFSTTIGDLTDKDKLVVRGGGRHLESCFIDTIHKLEKNN